MAVSEGSWWHYRTQKQLIIRSEPEHQILLRQEAGSGGSARSGSFSQRTWKQSHRPLVAIKMAGEGRGERKQAAYSGLGL